MNWWCKECWENIEQISGKFLCLYRKIGFYIWLKHSSGFLLNILNLEHLFLILWLPPPYQRDWGHLCGLHPKRFYNTVPVKVKEAEEGVRKGNWVLLAQARRKSLLCLFQALGLLLAAWLLEGKDLGLQTDTASHLPGSLIVRLEFWLLPPVGGWIIST